MYLRAVAGRGAPPPRSSASPPTCGAPTAAAGHLGAHLELGADRPEAEEPDPVLSLEQQLATLRGRQIALARVADGVAMYASASGRSISGMTPSPSSCTRRQAPPRSRTRVRVTV